MIAKYNNNTYIANLRDAHIVLMTNQKEKNNRRLFTKKRLL